MKGHNCFSAQPVLNQGYSSYTNCIVTLIWSDGALRTPPVMFTNDPGFRDFKISTERREAINSKRIALMEKYGITLEQVVFLGGTAHFVPESRHLLKKFGATVQVPSESVIFSDRGNAFFKRRRSVIPKYFGVQTATYPPVIHHLLSPNDNHFHGVAKRQWRCLAQKEGWDKDDGVESSLCLLSLLTYAEPEAICGYFKHNFFIGRKCVKPDRCMDLVTNGVLTSIRKNEYLAQAEAAYQKYESQVSRLVPDDGATPPCELENSLDGRYWSKTK